MKTIHDMAREHKLTYEQILDAVAATGLKGRMAGGTRVWSNDDTAAILKAVRPYKFTVRTNGANRPERFDTREEAAEFAQESLRLSPDAAWKIVTVF